MSACPCSKLIFFLGLILLASESVSLRLSALSVPSHKVVGDTASLSCRFDMQGDTLYSVKWYKDEKEFYRFVPNDRPRLQVFPRPGINVDSKFELISTYVTNGKLGLTRSRSSKHSVFLRDLSVSSGGTYKCEVSAEAPSFRTKSAEHAMVVVVTPEFTDIRGVRPRYAVGDLVNVTCYSFRSKPAASLVWRVNEEEVVHGGVRYDGRQHERGHQMEDFNFNPFNQLGAELIEHQPVVEQDELETSALGLMFEVQPQHMNTGLKLECSANIGSVHWQKILETVSVAPRPDSIVSNTWWQPSKATNNDFCNNILLLVLILHTF